MQKFPFFLGALALITSPLTLAQDKAFPTAAELATMSDAELQDLRRRVPDLTIHPDLSSFADFIVLRDRRTHGEDAPVATHMGELT